MQPVHATKHAGSSLFGTTPPLKYSWDTFQKDLKTQFLPPQYLDRLRNESHALKQNNAPVLPYASKVIQLGVQLRKTDEEQLRAFLYGLEHLIKFDVQM